MFTCGNPRLNEHQHETAYQARVCYGLIQTKTYTEPLATDKQRDYLRNLGATNLDPNLTKKAASAMIDKLAHQPVPPKPPVRDIERENLEQGMALILPVVPEGYFAVRKDDTMPYTFLRIRTVKTGNYKGVLKVSTQHGDAFKDRFYIYNGKVKHIEWRVPKSVYEAVMLAATDPDETGLAYAQELGRCLRCHATLTDERSRWYGIGPECEKLRGSIIEKIDLRHGGRSYEQCMVSR